MNHTYVAFTALHFRDIFRKGLTSMANSLQFEQSRAEQSRAEQSRARARASFVILVCHKADYG